MVQCLILKLLSNNFHFILLFFPFYFYRARTGNPRRFADEIDRPRSVLSSGIVAAKIPTRVIPDMNGFDQLSRNEIKRDMRDIEKSFIMSATNEDSDSDGEAELQRTVKSRNPKAPCPPGSTLHRKRHRYLAWADNPASIKTDLASYVACINSVEAELEFVVEGENDWLNTFDEVRQKLSSAIWATQKQNKILKQQCEVLQKKSYIEIGLYSRKRRSAMTRDLVGELEDLKDVLVTNMKDYERVVNDYTASSTSNKGAAAVPIVHIVLDPSDMVENTSLGQAFPPARRSLKWNPSRRR